MTPKRVFVDAAFLIALAVESDQWHRVAIAWQRKAEHGRFALLTTWAVLLEVGNSLAKLQFREAGAQLIESVLADPSFTVLPLSEPFLRGGFDLFSRRDDKEWGLTDCLSFVAMDQHGIREALTSDEHFQQAGYRALLRES